MANIFTAHLIHIRKDGKQIKIWLFPMFAAIIAAVALLLMTFKPITNIQYRRFYSAVREAVNEHEPSLTYKNPPSQDIVYRALSSIYGGDPENYIVGNFETYRDSNSLTIRFTYYDFGKDYDSARKELDERVDAIVAKMPEGLSDYGKVKWANDYICENYSYGGGHAPLMMLRDGEGVCSAYAALFHLIMNRCGVTCRTLTGDTETVAGSLFGFSSNHAWNMVKLGIFWYHIDVTWNDDGSSSSDEYFLVSDSYMRSHRHYSWTDSDNFRHFCFFNYD